MQILRPDHAGYAEACTPWNLNARQSPAVVAIAESASDVTSAVRLALEEVLGVGVMATGHGTATPNDDGLLINTTRMRSVQVDPVARTARVGAGARWTDVIAATAPYGLSGLPGSSPHVGVVGYTCGGGFGWLGRRYGFAASSVTSADIVTAAGELGTVDASHHPDVFWGLKGGGSNFGIVTSVEFALHRVDHVYAGNLFYPTERATEVLAAYVEWTTTMPDEMATAIAFRRFPPLATVPEQLRGETRLAVRVIYCGGDLAEGERLTRPLRDALGDPTLDTLGELPAACLDTISMDPVDPIGVLTHSALLPDLSPAACDTLVGLGTDSPLAILELRQLGGALSRSDGPHPMGSANAAFTMAAIGVTPSPSMLQDVRHHLRRVETQMAAHVTGSTYVNHLDLAGATPQRIRAAYSAADWSRLVALKDRYDPANLFRFNRNIPPSGGTR